MKNCFVVFIAFALPLGLMACGGVQVSQDPFDPLGDWHQRHLACGHPTFMYRLPLDAQEKIRQIWAHYAPGDECDKEKDETRQVIQSIPEEVRFKIFHGMCGPAFLKDATPAVRSQFQNAWFDDKLSLDEKETEFKKLAYSLLTGDALKKFNQFEADLQERKKARQQTIDSFSPAAKEAYDKWNNMRKEERLYLASLPQDIRAELKLVCTFCGTHKVGQTGDSHHHQRSRRSAYVDAIQLHRQLRQANQQLLTGSDCSLVF
ncbi:hypothetical protein M3Y97_00499900 [Aphelenchoides bicaudatus]|nr:hypothetical protein M3Y97_00499900 [Aphelenchoides bicaudatus]